MLRSRPSPALIVACIALFVALGGVSYGLATGSIDSREIKNGTIRSEDMGSSSVTAREIRRRSLDGTDIKVERVGGDAVKEQVLEAGKIGKVSDSDKLDGQDSTAYKVRWALVDENGAIVEQSGGFTVVSRPGINGQLPTNPNIYINAGASLAGKGLSASTAIQNTVDRGGTPDPDPAFEGDVAVGRCATPAINCVPAGTNTDNTLVVRSLADNSNVASQTRRFYVEVSE